MFVTEMLHLLVILVEFKVVYNLNFIRNDSASFGSVPEICILKISTAVSVTMGPHIYQNKVVSGIN